MDFRSYINKRKKLRNIHKITEPIGQSQVEKRDQLVEILATLALWPFLSECKDTFFAKSK